LDRGAVGFLRNVLAKKTPPTSAPMAMRSLASSISATKMVMLGGRMAARVGGLNSHHKAPRIAAQGHDDGAYRTVVA